MAKSSRTWFGRIWMAFAVLVFIVLWFASLGVIALRITNTLPEGVDAYFIVGKEPSYKVQDGETKAEWSENHKISIFQTSYENGERETTVLSQNGDKIIAPGTISTYDFCICNDGNMAIVYELDFSFLLTINKEESAAETFPLLIRIQRQNANYVLGDETTWANISSSQLAKHKGTLGPNSYEHFILELQWAFEGNDELDTELGNASMQVPVELNFEIGSYAEEHSNPKAQGGIQLSEEGFQGEYGGVIRWEKYLLLLFATAALLLGILYLF